MTRPSGKAAAPFRHLGQGSCAVCGEATLRPDGTPSRRCWHDGRDGETNCLRDYQFNAGWTQAVRSAVFDRDAGRCALCPVDSAACDTAERVMPWAADHIVPLADGGEHTMENLQTLCEAHHVAKTSREATARAAARRRPDGQVALEL